MLVFDMYHVSLLDTSSLFLLTVFLKKKIGVPQWFDNADLKDRYLHNSLWFRIFVC